MTDRFGCSRTDAYEPSCRGSQCQDVRVGLVHLIRRSGDIFFTFSPLFFHKMCESRDNLMSTICCHTTSPWIQPMNRALNRRWRDYATRSGRRPVRDFIMSLNDREVADIIAAMKDVARNGLSAARHLEGDIYEVRAYSDQQTFRILFAKEGRYGQVLLALNAFSKKQQKTPRRQIMLAKRRLVDWRSRKSGDL